MIILRFALIFNVFILLSYLNNIAAQESEQYSSSFLNHLLETGIIYLSKNKQKEPEELNSVISSIRIRNKFLSNRNIFQFQESQVLNKQNPFYINYTLFFKDFNLFMNLSHKFSNSQTIINKYYDTNNNFTLDTYIHDYKDSRFKFGSGFLDYFKDSYEFSLYYRTMQTNGIYTLQTREVPPEYASLLGGSSENYLLYNLSNSGSFSFINGTNKVRTDGFGFVMGWNFKFWEIFSIYNSLDLYFFKIHANLSTYSPSVEFYNDTKKQLEYGSQILHVTKNLNFNMNMYYEIGFAITFADIGFKWGSYWNLPLILDADYKKPKGYIINISDQIYIQDLNQEINLFYKSDPSNQTKTFQLGLVGITFGLIKKI